MKAIERLRKELLARAEEFAARSRAWDTKDTKELSAKAGKIKAFVEDNFDNDHEELLGLCSILIGEDIPVSEQKEYEPGLFLTDEDNDTLFTIGGLEGDDGTVFGNDETIDSSNESYNIADITCRPATVAEIRKFIERADKVTLLDMDEILGAEGEEE